MNATLSTSLQSRTRTTQPSLFFHQGITMRKFRHHLKACALLALLLAQPGLTWAQAARLEVLAAWYGTEAGAKADTIRQRRLTDSLTAAVNNGQLQVPGNMNVFFNGDPFPGVAKVLAVAVRLNGNVVHIRQAEGSNLVFPGTPGVTYLPAPLDAVVDVDAAWYGVEGSPATGPALERVRRGMLNGNLYVPADMNTFFGSDPAPGRVKQVAIAVRHKGRTYNLRQIEGKELKFPGVDGEDYLEMLDASAADVRSVFDAVFYKLKNPDLSEAFGSNPQALWEHYLNYGIKEGRDPNATLSVAALRARYPQLQQLYGSDYSRYVQHTIALYKRNTPIQGDPSITTMVDRGIFSNPRLANFDANYYFFKNPAVCAEPLVTIPTGGARNCTLPAGVLMDVPKLQEHFLVAGAKANLRAHNHPTGTPQSANGRESMRIGDWLSTNQFLISRNGANVAIMQGNGDFAGYRTGDPRAISSGNYSGLHTGVNLTNQNDTRNGFFVTMQGDGKLCTYKGTSPADNKGFVSCTPNNQAVGRYYFHLQSDNNFLIRAGNSVFDDAGYVWDFRTTKAAAPSFFNQAVSGIKSALSCN